MTDTTSSRVRPLHVTWAFAGLAIALVGLVPMATALSVSNILIDTGGIEPGEIEIMDSWDAWAFSPLFISLTLFGAIGLALLLVVVPRHQKAGYAVATFVILGACLFIAMFITGWFFHDIHLQ